MPVTEQTPVNASTGNGVTTVFPYTYLILAQADIEVLVDDVVQTLTTDYTVSGVGNPSGGNVTFGSAPINGASVVLRRNMQYKRTTDYQENGDLTAATLDADNDSTVLLLQQLASEFVRALKLPKGTTTDQELTGTAADRANKYIAFDSSGNLTTASSVDPGALVVSAFMETLLDDLDAASARATLGAWGGAGSDIASAATIDLTASTGNMPRVTGTTTTTNVTINAGQRVWCYAVGAWPLTHHATNLPLPGSADYTCSAGDMLCFSKDNNGDKHIEIISKGLHPVIVSQAVAEAGTDTTARLWTAERVAQAIAALSSGGLTSGTVVATSTGATSYNTTGISGAKFISFGFGGISTNGTSSVMIRVGPSGGVVNTGYVGAVYDGTTSSPVTDGFYIDNFGAAAAVRHGRGTMQLIDAATNTWSWECSVLSSDSNRAQRSACGTISLAGELTQFTLIANGTDTFDAGKLNYLAWS